MLFRSAAEVDRRATNKNLLENPEMLDALIGVYERKMCIRDRAMSYQFWGWEHADAPAITEEYPGIHNPRQLYDALSKLWCADTCAPRMRKDWTKENPTLGQCSITAFLAQDIFGGKVYGVLRPGGNYHCYNVIGDWRFDLTSEQFGEEALDYENNPEQFREVHFAKEEKRQRYEALKAALKAYCSAGNC